MRLAFSGVGMPSFREVTREYLQFYKDIGFHVLGGSIDLEASEDDIKRLRDLFGEMDLAAGECHIGAGTMAGPDKNKLKEYKKKIIRGLEVGGKLGINHLQFSIGSMHPDNIWMHHPENHTQNALDMLVKNAREIAPYAEDNRCMIAPETTQWTIVNSIERMKEYVDRVDSPYMKITFDFVNHMTSERIYDSGRYIMHAVAILGDRIGNFHVKDVMAQDMVLVSHIDEAPMGTGLLDHEAVIKASTQLEPWKTFVLEHISSRDLIKPAFDHIQGVARRIGHQWTDPLCTRERWEKGMCK